MYARADYPAMNDFILDNLAIMSSGLLSIDEMWNELKLLILQARELYVPKFKIPNKLHPKWFDSSVRHQLNCTRNLRKKYRTRPSNINLLKLLFAERELQSLILTAKEIYMTKITSEFSRNPRRLYNHLHLLTSSKSRPEFFLVNDTPIYDDQQIVNAFNNFFHSTFTKPSDFMLPSMYELPTPSQLSTLEVTKLDVYDALLAIDETKVYGCDEIHHKILKQCLLSLLDAIHTLFVRCLSLGTIPAEWKRHKITPIPKKGSLLEISNYRPISLLCILSKVLESIIFNKIINFIRPKISPYQFGFMKGKSCLSQLLHAFSVVHEAFDKRKQVDMIYLDFRKAFDSVPYKELLYKLWIIGITGDLWLWFKSYLSGRSHYVAYDNVSSETCPVLSGVPQGSILGPLLFIVYVNDILDAITHSSCFMFADDVKLLKVISSALDHLDLQEDLENVSSWCKQWNLTLSCSKCSGIQFSSRLSQESNTYNIDGSIIPFVESKCDLGVVVSSNLSWSNHYDRICSKSYKALYVIRRNVPFYSSIQLKKQLYLTLVKSKISYCCQLWRPHLVKDTQSLERVQQRATNYILQDYTSDYKSRLLSLNILPLMYWLELQDLIFLIKCLKDPQDTNNIYQFCEFC